MKIAEYNEMMAYLTRPEPEVLPQPKPQELLDIQEQSRKGRLLDSLNKIGGGLEDSSLDFINRENFENGTIVKTPEQYRKNLLTKKRYYEKQKADPNFRLDKRLEQVKNFKDMMETKLNFNKSIEQGKALDDKGTGMSEIFDYMDKSFSKGNPIPRSVDEKSVIEMEQMIKNMEMKDRKLNAQGGLNYLMGL